MSLTVEWSSSDLLKSYRETWLPNIRFVRWSYLNNGVPVKPMNDAYGRAILILRASLPAWVRWASSEITIISSRRLYGSSGGSSLRNFWMRVKINLWFSLRRVSSSLADPVRGVVLASAILQPTKVL